MNKLQVQKRVLQNGKPIALDEFTWDAVTKTLRSEEHDLVLDFRGINGCTFNTSSDCTFKTGSYCTFNTGSHCTFNTSSHCTFKTCFGCTFKTNSDCAFKTAFSCTFDTGDDCVFKTSSHCTFNTGSYCTFDTGDVCTFKAGFGCVVVRRDIYEVIELVENKTIELNSFKVIGYTTTEPKKTIVIDGKTIEISEESFNAFKEQFNK